MNTGYGIESTTILRFWDSAICGQSARNELNHRAADLTYSSKTRKTIQCSKLSCSLGRPMKHTSSGQLNIGQTRRENGLSAATQQCWWQNRSRTAFSTLCSS